ncbi:MAG: hypothetical protein LBC77_09415 [Spirochaetaceae bacterium]|jgi:hypothetical protein|nr:hypothetical protein [Spirochaetaceae bacterium]
MNARQHQRLAEFLKKKKQIEFWCVFEKAALCGLALFAFFLAVCFSVYIANGLKIHIAKPEPVAQEAPPIAEKPVLYVTAVTPYVFLGAESGARLVTLDENLNERVFKFHSEKEAARFLGDISHNYEIADYTGLIQTAGGAE